MSENTTDNNKKRIKELFFAAYKIKSPQERSRHLDTVCGSNARLRQELESLLEAHGKSDSLLKSMPAFEDGILDDTSLSEGPGVVIDRYKLLERIGEGGMAVVYMAEQEQPIRRKVAMKIIKLGMDTQQVIARFEAERQALALMDHPNIAKVFDAGATETGRPYFVMELVQGVSITEYCDQHSLSTHDRLGLFTQVCNAIQHAHQKGIIHRDIKPSNIMVTQRDGTSVPKVIDFGIAKATNQRLTEKTVFTRYAHIIGTPAYMSPEQAELSELDVDTRSDIYSLGVLLYELLTGTTPFSEEELRKAGYAEMTRIIREKEPARPSTRVRQTHSQPGSVSRLTPDPRPLDPDLDWIVMKSLEKDRDRRYETANALGTDVERHLASEPILARGPSSLYQLRKFIYRNRVAVATTVVILTVIVFMGTIISRWNEDRRQLEQERTRLAEDEDIRHRAYLEKACASLADRDFSAALKQLKLILDSKYVGSQAQFLYAGILVEGQQPDEAVTTLEKLLRDQTEIAWAAHSLLARVLWESLSTGDQKSAREHQRMAETLSPQTPEPYFLRALTAITIKEKLEYLHEALRLDPGHYESYRLRAFINYASRKYEKVERDALVMVALKPKDALGYSLRAKARHQLGQYEDADEAYDRAIDLTTPEDRQYIDLIAQRCDTLMAMGQYDRVIACARQYLEVAGDALPITFRIFCAQIALGDYEDANSLFRQVTESNPGIRIKFRDWSGTYVFDTLAAERAWHPPESEPQGAAFLPMLQAELCYEHLAGKARRLIPDAFTGSWSPDGGQLAYSTGFLGYNGIALYEMATGETKLLITPGKDPAWSPDGQWIAFVRDCPRLRVEELANTAKEHQGPPVLSEEIWIIRADGTDAQRLAHGSWPTWGRNSDVVYYVSHQERMFCSISSTRPGTEPTRIMPSKDCMPSASPDNRYVSYFQGGFLSTVDLESHHREVMHAVPSFRWGVTGWSPANDEIYLGGGGSDDVIETGLWIYNLNSRELQQVFAGTIWTACWSPDATQLAFFLSSPSIEVWIANLDPNVSTAESLRAGQTPEDYYQAMVYLLTRMIETDPADITLYLQRAQYYKYLQDMDHYQADIRQYQTLYQSTWPATWPDTGFRFGEPENLGPIVSTPAYEIRPLPSLDGLSLRFGRDNLEGYFDTLWATRKTTNDAWETAEISESCPSDLYIPNIMTEDGLELYVHVLDEHGVGELAVRKRTSRDDDWGEPENLGPIVNSPAVYERRPAITADGLELYFMDKYSGIRPGGCGWADLWMTRRATRHDPWQAPENLSVNSSSGDGWPYISQDGLLLLFSSDRPGGFGSGDLYASWRASRTDPWEGPVNLGPGVNTRGGDWAPCLSADHSVLYFESNRPGGHGDMDIWQVPVLEMKKASSLKF